MTDNTKPIDLSPQAILAAIQSGELEKEVSVSPEIKEKILIGVAEYDAYVKNHNAGANATRFAFVDRYRAAFESAARAIPPDQFSTFLKESPFSIQTMLGIFLGIRSSSKESDDFWGKLLNNYTFNTDAFSALTFKDKMITTLSTLGSALGSYLGLKNVALSEDLPLFAAQLKENAAFVLTSTDAIVATIEAAASSSSLKLNNVADITIDEIEQNTLFETPPVNITNWQAFQDAIIRNSTSLACDLQTITNFRALALTPSPAQWAQIKGRLTDFLSRLDSAEDNQQKSACFTVCMRLFNAGGNLDKIVDDLTMLPVYIYAELEAKLPPPTVLPKNIIRVMQPHMVSDADYAQSRLRVTKLLAATTAQSAKILVAPFSYEAYEPAVAEHQIFGNALLNAKMPMIVSLGTHSAFRHNSFISMGDLRGGYVGKSEYEQFTYLPLAEYSGVSPMPITLLQKINSGFVMSSVPWFAKDQYTIIGDDTDQTYESDVVFRATYGTKMSEIETISMDEALNHPDKLRDKIVVIVNTPVANPSEEVKDQHLQTEWLIQNIIHISRFTKSE